MFLFLRIEKKRVNLSSALILRSIGRSVHRKQGCARESSRGFREIINRADPPVLYSTYMQRLSFSLFFPFSYYYSLLFIKLSLLYSLRYSLPFIIACHYVCFNYGNEKNVVRAATKLHHSVCICVSRVWLLRVRVCVCVCVHQGRCLTV